MIKYRKYKRHLKIKSKITLKVVAEVTITIVPQCHAPPRVTLLKHRLAYVNNEPNR